MIGDKFHAHLDACAQCRDNPFDLCARGLELFEEAIHEATTAVLAIPVRSEDGNDA